MAGPEFKEPAAQKAGSIPELIAGHIQEYPDDEETLLFRNWFAEKYGQNLVAVIFFGSCLSEKSKSATSFKDFIVVVDKYRKTGKNPVKWLSHWTLPPDLFHLSLQKDGTRHECKYYLISTPQLLDATGPRARDLYLMGRLSKRIAVIFYRDQAGLGLVVQAQAQALRRAAELSLALLDGFDLEQFIKAVMRLSYLAETRLEDERKVDSLYDAHPEFYRRVYSRVLDEIVAQGMVRSDGENRWRAVREKAPFSRKEIDDFLAKSRKRFKARWPKMIITVDNWLDQLLGKLERTYGIKLEIPPWERPVILITGWRHYFRLKKQGKIHEHNPEE
jgi:hypothetical protein